MDRETQATWQEIRALRAAPTGKAAGDSDRRRTFVASLRQAQELAEGASAAGYATKPLPLFYALSQAGRAIAAARLSDPWQLAGHGLSVSADPAKPVLENVVGPQGKGSTSYAGVSKAVGSSLLSGSATLGELWAANPDLSDVEIPASEGNWPGGLEFVIGAQSLALPGEDREPSEVPVTVGGGVLAIPVEVPGQTGREVAEAIKAYPTLRGAFAIKKSENGPAKAGPDDEVIRSQDLVTGADRVNLGTEVGPDTNYAEFWKAQREFASVIEIDRTQPTVSGPVLIGYALPEIAGGACPSPLMLWWGLMIGLSSLARYYPATWTDAINLDASELAVGLERVLDTAERKIPVRILEAFQGSAAPQP